MDFSDSCRLLTNARTIKTVCTGVNKQHRIVCSIEGNDTFWILRSAEEKADSVAVAESC